MLDVQAYADARGVALARAGVRDVQMPFRLLQKDGRAQTVAARVSMTTRLAPEVKGAHMSRFIIQLAEWSRLHTLSLNFNAMLQETMMRLEAPAAALDLSFPYFIDKKAPVTDHSAPMAYRCSFHAHLNCANPDAPEFQLILGLTVPIATLCPCSKAISDYGAHNQRAEIRLLSVMQTTDNGPQTLNGAHHPGEDHPMVWIEDLVSALESCASCPVYPVLKREDEKYVTERQYDNPKFVEDVARDAILLLRDLPGVAGFALEVEALESIHGHNAWAGHEEGFSPLGLRPAFP
ncbi:MAG: GTP cyclohydrolase I FolE2 [Vampirovibrionales bacterium]|nr:GTP cyclohydrolase I FolE2 [Vampirovibrionales bacterium]